MSHLQNKSEILVEVAKLLHDKTYYPAVAHSAYYSCFQLLKHIWLHKMSKTEQELISKNRNSKEGSHEVLINEICSFIKASSPSDCRNINSKITQLKRLRVNADYDDSVFDSKKSANSLLLSKEIIPILKKY